MKKVISFLLFFCFLFLHLEVDAQRRIEQIPNANRFAVPQHCQYWCWAACCAMLLNSQNINITQEELVRKVYPNQINLPCIPTGGSFIPIKRALDGIYRTADGRRIKITCRYYDRSNGQIYSKLQDGNWILRAIREGRPIIVEWNGHGNVIYGLDYNQRNPYTPITILVYTLKTIDPGWELFPVSKYYTRYINPPNSMDPPNITGFAEIFVSY